MITNIQHNCKLKKKVNNLIVIQQSIVEWQQSFANLQQSFAFTRKSCIKITFLQQSFAKTWKIQKYNV